MTFQRDQRQIFSIRKFKAYGAASVLLGLLTLGVNGQTQANTLSSATVTIEESVLTKEPEVLPLPKTPGETSPSVSPVETLTQEEPEGDGVSKLHSLSQTLDKSVLSKRLEGLKKRELSQENEAFRVQFDEVLTKAQEVLTKSEVTVEELTKLLADLDQLEALLGREQSDKDKKENTENAQLSDVRDLPKESMLTQALAVSEHLGTESGADVLEQAAAVSVLQAALEKVGHPALDLQELNDLLTFVQKELHKPLSREIIQGMALALDDFRKQSQAQAADQVVRETTPATSSRSRRQRRALDDQDWATAEEKAQIQSEKADRQRTLDDYFRNEYGRYLRKVDHQYVLEGDDIQPIRLSETDAFIINTKKYPDGLDRGEPIGVNAKDARTPELLNRINAKLNLMGLSAAYMSGSKTIEISGKINRADKVTGERLQWFVQILHGNNASATEFLKHTGSIQKSSGIPASNSTGVSIHLFDVYSTNKKDYLDNFAKDRDKIINEIQQASPYYNNWQVSNWTQRLNRLKGHLPGYRTSFPTALHQKLGINTKAYDVEIPETTKAKDINDVTPVPKTMYVEDLGQLRVEELVSVSRKPEAANYRPTDGIYNKESATFASTEPKREVGVQNIDVKVVFGDKSEIIVSVPLTLNSSEYEFFIKTVDEELEKYKGMIENKDQKRPLTQESRQHIENELEKIAQEIREEIEKLKPKRHNQIRPYFYREVGRMYLVLYKERALIEIDMEKERLTEVINGNDDLTSEDQRVLLADVEKQARLYKEVVAEKGVIRDPLPGEGSSRHHAAGNRIEHAIYELKNLGIIEHKATRVAENKKIAREEIAAKAKEITDFLKDDTTLSPEDKERLTNNLNTVKQEVEQAFERRTIEHILTGAFGNIQPEFKRIKDEEIAKLQLLLDEAKKFAVAKKNAKDAIDAEVNRVKQKITNNNNLTETDKERLKEEATQAGETAKAEIDKKVTTDEVTNDKEDQVRKVTAVGTTAQDLGEAKKQAKAMIEEALNKVKEVITNNDNLTPADQQRLEAEATQVAKDAKAAIDAKADKDGVTDSQAAQVATVTAVGDKATALGNAKVDAKAELDRQAETAKQAITATPHLTAEDQDRLKAEVTKAVDDAKAAIDTQASPETVTQAKDAGIQAIDAVQAKSGELGQVKADAKAEVTAKLADVIQAIADNGDLTQDDKDRLTQEANQAADRAKAELDAKETTAEVTDAKQAQVDTVTA
ncbi:DUF1542 domain-containing protein, partial [Streptococcus pluranimalium]|uniref:DUF1542 domain-containing protein n=1 Tax=Streptococcus pluranimalium TaxID=82348 RepID=UPI0039FC00B8